MRDRLPRDEVLAILNDYFDAVTRPVLARGGEILKFIGDCVVAIFRMKDGLDRDEKCRAALAAAGTRSSHAQRQRTARQRRQRRSASASASTPAGQLRQHRLADPARFHGHRPGGQPRGAYHRLCRPLNHRLLASRAFASPCGSKLVPLGHYPLHGFDQPQEVYALPEE